MHIGERIKALMEEQKVSVKAMALHCGVTSGAVSNWFKTGRISKENLLQVAGLLGTTADDVIAGTPLGQKPQATDIGRALESVARSIAKLPKLDRRQVATLLPLLAEEPETRQETCGAIMRLLDASVLYRYAQDWEEAAAEVATELGQKKLTASELIAWVEKARVKPAQPVLLSTTSRKAR